MKSDLNWITDLLTDFKKENDVQGMAFALFDSTEIIYENCLGKSSYNKAINRNTLFSIQSISKNFTALAVMTAVRDSLINLQTPISEYLPDFTINSCFDDNPMDKITIEMLPAHTAGFTHDAPIGSNSDLKPCTFEEHLKSIEDTWLKFPVGTNYAYSNLGMDLAAHIIEKESGLSFNEYLKAHIFTPLSMKSTTIDDDEVLANENRTEGIFPNAKQKHYKIPLMGSGAVYTNLNDFVNYVQFLMHHGQSEKLPMSDSLLLDMYTIRHMNYGLGTVIIRDNENVYINHDGGGYGYTASFVWFPAYNLGTIVLCNNYVNTRTICLEIMNSYISKTDRDKQTYISGILEEINADYFENPDLFDKSDQYYCTTDTLFKKEWEQYLGSYTWVYEGMEANFFAKIMGLFSKPYENQSIFREGEVMKMKINEDISTLREYKEGMFFTRTGEVLDFRTEPPSYRNIKLKKLK
jgi:CubicO group peptidase (beta-lactamase class C family)